MNYDLMKTGLYTHFKSCDQFLDDEISVDFSYILRAMHSFAMSAKVRQKESPSLWLHDLKFVKQTLADSVYY